MVGNIYLLTYLLTYYPTMYGAEGTSSNLVVPEVSPNLIG